MPRTCLPWWLGFAYGPGGGVAVGILTAILHGLLMADFSGAVMNIIVVLFYVLPAALIYKRMHTFAGAIIALVVGTLLAVVGAVLGNLGHHARMARRTARRRNRDDRADPYSVQPLEGRAQFRPHAHYLQVDLEPDYAEEGSEERSRLDDLLRRRLLHLHERKLCARGSFGRDPAGPIRVRAWCQWLGQIHVFEIDQRIATA